MLRPEQWMPQAEALNALSMQCSFDSYPSTRLGDTWMALYWIALLFSQGLSLGNLFTSPSWSSAKRPSVWSTLMNLCTTVLSQQLVIFTSYTKRWLNSLHETVWLWALPCTAGISKTFQACLARRIWADSCILRCQIEEAKLNLKTIMQTYTHYTNIKHRLEARVAKSSFLHPNSLEVRDWEHDAPLGEDLQCHSFHGRPRETGDHCVIARQNAYARVLMNTAAAAAAATTYCLHLLSYAEIL